MAMLNTQEQWERAHVAASHSFPAFPEAHGRAVLG